MTTLSKVKRPTTTNDPAKLAQVFGPGTFLGSLSQAMNQSLPQINVAPPDPGIYGNQQAPAPVTDPSADLAAQLDAILSGGGGGGGGGGGAGSASGNNYLTDLGLQQAHDLIQYQQQQLNSMGNVTFGSLNEKNAYLANQYNQQLALLNNQFDTSRYNLNAGAAAAGAYVAPGTNKARSSLDLQQQLGTRGLTDSFNYNKQQIQHAIEKAYISQMLKGFSLDQQLKYNDTQLFLRGLAGV